MKKKFDYPTVLLFISGIIVFFDALFLALNFLLPAYASSVGNILYRVAGFMGLLAPVACVLLIIQLKKNKHLKHKLVIFWTLVLPLIVSSAFTLFELHVFLVLLAACGRTPCSL